MEWYYILAIVLGSVLVLGLLIFLGMAIGKKLYEKDRYNKREKPVVYKGRAMKRTGMNYFTPEEATFKRTGDNPDYEQTLQEKWHREDRDKINNPKK